LELTGDEFEIFRTAVKDNLLTITAFTNLCHGYYNSKTRFPSERLSIEEYDALASHELLRTDEQLAYARYLKRQENAPEKDSNETTGLTKIYLIRDNATELVKIGQSHDPVRRLKTLVDQATLMPTANEFVLIHNWEATGIVERQLHERYADKRIRGEWFLLTQADIDEIIELST
ncbi:MAG TPA: GIY-YIG nuclease family protein, partial [Pyrinomonadaceae bacterium]|nr:GIY-YIG nuclease family protein [Pyrinomonadaceae bacterium]